MKSKTILKAVSIYSLLSLILALSINVAAQPKKDLKKANDLVQLGDKAYQEKNYRDAANQYAQAIAVIPKYPYAHYRKGFAHFNLKEYDLALAEFTLALNQGHKPLDIYRVRSYIYLAQKNYVAAIPDIQNGLALAPSDLN